MIKRLLGLSNIDGNLNEIVKKGAFLVDVRTPEEFTSGHVDGSINIPLDTVHDNIEMFKNKSHIVVFCRSGNRSGQAKNILAQQGITNVTNGGPWQDVDAALKS
jgi:rhodanese-related sulfurtransferase